MCYTFQLNEEVRIQEVVVGREMDLERGFISLCFLFKPILIWSHRKILKYIINYSILRN